MKRLKNFFCKILPLIAVFISVCTGFGCAPQGDAHDFYYFKTQVHVQTQTSKLSSTVIEQIDSTLSHLDALFAVNNSSSFTAKFNASGVGSLQADQTVISVLKKCKQLYQFTDGAFNPAVLPLVELWSFDRYPVLNFAPPTQEQTNALLNSGALDFSKLTINEQDFSVYKPHPDMKIDLGGVVKGYACDQITQIMLRNGYKDGYVNLGGSSLNIISMPTLSVAHPRESTSILTIDCSNLPNLSVSTSGDYQRYYEYQGKRYSHIIDGRIGTPAYSTVASATITGVEGVIADGLSTALCVCTYTNDTNTLTPMLNQILTQYPTCQIYVVVIDGQNKYVISNQVENQNYTLHDTTFTTVKI